MWKMKSPSPEPEWMQPCGPMFVEQKERLNSDPACHLHWVLSVPLTAQPLCPRHSPQENELRHWCWVVACYQGLSYT